MQEFYYELVVRPSSHRELFLNFLSELFWGGIEESDEGFILRGDAELAHTEGRLAEYAQNLSKALGESVTVETSLSQKRNIDWIDAYKKSITPVEVPPFYIHPSWSDPKEGFVNITIDPALAFGSGHHPTTEGCLGAIAKHVRAGKRVLDVGCGSGILGIAAARLGASVDICDTDELALSSSRENFSLNGVAFENAWVGSAAKARGEYDVVIANIVADILVFIALDLKSKTKRGGILILSGIVDKYRQKVLDKFSDLRLLDTLCKEEWVTLILKKD